MNNSNKESSTEGEKEMITKGRLENIKMGSENFN